MTDEQILNEKAYLLDTLRENVVIFQYKKADGTPRIACGTLKPALLPVKKAGMIQDMINFIRRVADEPVTVEECNAFLAIIDAPPKESASTPKPSNWINYYDLGVDDWRKFEVTKFVGIDARY